MAIWLIQSNRAMVWPSTHPSNACHYLAREGDVLGWLSITRVGYQTRMASSLRMPTRCISGCRGLSRTLRSTFITADGTFKAAVRPLVSHDDPSDWSAVGAGTECQPSGSDTSSSISVVRSSGSSKASSLKSVGAVSGSTWTSTSSAASAAELAM